jgi:hypothetical protein
MLEEQRCFSSTQHLYWSTQPPIQSVLDILPQGIQQPESEFDYSYSSIAEA